MVALCVAVGLASLGATGCRVSEDDVHRWEQTAHGPDKLKAVLQHDKYDNNLRVEAALSLVRMKPRAGRRVGIGIMVDTLASVAPETRQGIVGALVPALILELKKPPPVAQAGQPAPPDPSFSYKDAAFALLTRDGTVMIADEGLKQNLKLALIDWAMADFVHRLDNRTQTYGMEQLLRLIGPPAVAGIPKLMVREARKLDQMASLVAELGDDKAKLAASQAMVAVAQYVASDEWLKIKTPELQAANAASKKQPTEAQFKSQLSTYQEEELIRTFGTMKKIGGRPVVDFLLDFAAKKDQSEKRRAAALAALEGRLDRNNPDDVKRIFAIATSDAPDSVVDAAFRRLSEMPREVVVEKLYSTFRNDTKDKDKDPKWKVRRVAAATVLRMSKAQHAEEFLGKLPTDPKGFALPEALTYGALLGDLKDGKPLDTLSKYFGNGTAVQRTVALGYWYSFGTPKDLPTLAPFENDTAAAPTCDADADCKWSCDVAKEGAPKDAPKETKEVKTIGDFVRYCVEPEMKSKPEPKK